MNQQTHQETIQVPYPDSEPRQLVLKCNGCRLSLNAAEAAHWITGTSTYQRPPGPQISQTGGETRIEQNYPRSELTNMFRVAKDSPHLDLSVSAAQAFALAVSIVSDSAELNLGGLALDEVRIAAGLGSAEITFKTPHPGQLPALEFENLGGQIELHNAQNAHATTIILGGRMGTTRLYYDSLPSQAGLLVLNADSVATSLQLPHNIALTIVPGDGITLSDKHITLHPEGRFQRGNEVWATPAALDSLSPMLTLRVDSKAPLNINLADE
ncbi:MAG: hypothetical protein ACLFTK_04815 [Anaerolineales bacterium]